MAGKDRAMNGLQLAHVLRAAADVVGDGRILVIGSQAVLASFDADDLPDRATMSVEADVAFFDDAEDAKSDQVDGAIGEGSMFHTTFGYYGQGVSVGSATLPDGWQDRLVPFRLDGVDHGAVCLDIHDLVVSKLVAGREKDFEYAAALVTSGHVSVELLRERANLLPVLGAVMRRVLTSIDRLERRPG